VNAASVAGEPGARRVSPFLFLLVILTFFLVFTGVSCNTATTKAALGSIDGSEGVTAAQGAQVVACINSLNGVNILTYNGWQLAFGKDPVIGTVPAACNQNNAAGTDTSSANIGPQLLAFLALLSVILGLIFASAGFLGLLAARSRALVASIFAAGAGALLILDQFHVRDVLLSKISASEGSSVPGIDPASLFSINPGTGLLVAVVILAVALLYNISALVIRVPAIATGEPLANPPDPMTDPPEPRANSPDQLTNPQDPLSGASGQSANAAEPSEVQDTLSDAQANPPDTSAGAPDPTLPAP
jgi:hypothetical protein